MKQIIFITCLMVSMLARGQEFSFQMYFEDALGNRDTLTIGYDPNGSRDSILPDFGEENIAHIPFDSVLDIRITNHVGYAKTNNDLFHTKKKIIYFNCDQQFPWMHPHPYVNIDISAANWPLKASWDSTEFENPCLNGSLFTPWYPADWWDTGVYHSTPWRTVLAKTSMVEFTPNYPENWEVNLESLNYYVDENNNIISTFWLAFGDSSLLTLNIRNNNIFSENYVFPNPTKGVIYLPDIMVDKSIKQIQLYDVSGRIYSIRNSGDLIDLTKFNNGLYFIRITLKNGNVVTQKIIKE